MIVKMDPEAIRAMAAKFRATADSMESHMASITQSVTQAGWQSQAREEFIMQLAMLQSTTTQTVSALRMMAQAADQKAAQWEAIASVFNGPFHFLSGIWQQVTGFVGGLWSSLTKGIANLNWPSLPAWVLPGIGLGGAFTGLLPDWDFKKPDWWPFEKGEQSSGGADGSGSQGGSWGGEEKGDSETDDPPAIGPEGATDTAVPKVDYANMPWSEKTSHYEDYRQELADLEASGQGNSERADYLRTEIASVETIMSEGIPPDGPTEAYTKGLYTGCTNYVAGKRDVYGFSKNHRPHAGGWNDAAKKAGYDVGKVPVKGAIMVIEPDKGHKNGVMNVSDDYGHVVYVEDVQIVDNGYKITYSHGGWEKGMAQGTYIPKDNATVVVPFNGDSDVSYIYDKP